MTNQLGFDALLAQSDTSNRHRQEVQAHAHLPCTMDEALPYYRTLIEKHHVAMLDGDFDTVMRLRNEAHDLAYKLNGFTPGIIADEDSPGSMLDRLTRAPDDQIPQWGQSGSFVITVGPLRVRIEMDSLFGICGLHTSWIGFGAHAVDLDKPFLSETGFRSFLGVGGALCSGYTTDSFARAVIEVHLAKELRGKLRAIDARYRS